MRVRLALLGAFMCVHAAKGDNVNYTDSFEAPVFDPYWTISQAAGTVGLTTSPVHSGNQAVQFVSGNGVQRTMLLEHAFSSGVNGSFVVYFFDNAPGQQTLYQQMAVYSSTNSAANMNIGTMDYDPNCYMTVSNGVGPGSSCGFPGDTATTSIPRSLGWHQLRIDVAPSAITGYIDGMQTYSQVGSSFTIDHVQIFMSGPGWRPNTVAFFDDYSASALPPTATPEPSTIASMALGLLGAVFLRRRQ